MVSQPDPGRLRPARPRPVPAHPPRPWECREETTAQLHWGPIATSLARSGYIVAAPNFGGEIHFASQADFDRLESSVQWVRGTSPFASVTFPWEIGIAGHSYGGLLAIRFAVRATLPPVSTIAVLGSSVGEDVENLDLLRNRFDGFRLFCWGGADTFGQIPDRDWSAAAGPGHAVTTLLGLCHRRRRLSTNVVTQIGLIGRAPIGPGVRDGPTLRGEGRHTSNDRPGGRREDLDVPPHASSGAAR